jgi:SNF2 family DNA or RNA helicase
LDGYLQREHFSTSAGRRGRSEHHIVIHQVLKPQMLDQIAAELDTPPIEFAANAGIVRTLVEGERLTYGYLFNPAFATEISLIDPLPHQRIAVYDHMLKQTRLRFLQADDAGAGKTIMTGLYIREMLTRRLISRVLSVPPAGLVGNWERELRTFFNLPFRIITGNEARSGNPFIGPNSDTHRQR